MLLLKTMKIAFVSRENAVRSIMAEAVAKKVFSDVGIKAEVFSAGTEPAEEVNPLTLQVLEKKGYPTKGLRPKPIAKIPYRKLDVLVTMCNEAKEKCEFVVSHKRRENWLIEEPSGGEASFMKTLEEVEEHIRGLIKLG
ncbi:low molecular weight phosphatase family protein [Hydrogenivirga sp. 128-5-R1-1]|uniref:arsenate-mycothiol transferase ArsC n=1 Tax=Hydrogenivirga sp. 128-5-R1-1 TaxID=392423 RepID=UPI0018DBA04D|nr:low molecular weight phosphatase family protein [Hydrogenivirga sp. 128-5-R1-1]